MEKYGKHKRYVHEHVDFLPYYKNNPTKQFKPKHAKPYRKRHALALGIFIILFGVSAFGLGMLLVRGAYQRNQAQEGVSTGQFSGPISLDSSLGYRLSFDSAKFSAEARVANSDGTTSTYISNDLVKARPYSSLQLTPLYDSLGRSVRYDNSVMNVALEKDEINQNTNILDYAQKYNEVTDQNFDAIKISQEEVEISGNTFAKMTYQKTPKFSAQSTATPSRTVIYVGNDYGHPLVIKIAGISDEFTPMDLYQQVIDSVVLENPNAEVLGAAYLHPDLLANWLNPLKNWLRNFIGEQETPEEKRARIVAAYTPAVVKIYHIVCGELIISKTSLGYDCLTTTGSGFMVSSDGYLATSGHVVSVSAKDIIVETIRSKPETLESVLLLLGYSRAEANQTLNAAYQDPSALLAVLQQIYKLPDDTIHFNNQKDHYGIALGTDQLTLINEDNKENLDIKETDTVKKAELVKVDYNSADLVNDTFTGSDVALLKIEGHNYPLVSIGDASLLTQGVPIVVVGYPALAENELTDNTVITATATDGVVSAIRDSNDGQHKIVQSDVVISGGNSGGPAFDQDGKVFGIATYIYQAADGGELSYMRDIVDLLNLA